MQDFQQAEAYVNALGGGVFDFRAIHDKRKDIPAIPFRGTLQECWSSICHYNNQGYGIFACTAILDGVGNKLPNVQQIRAHFLDLDNLNAMQMLQAANNWFPKPSFYVQTSMNKAHVYWPVQTYHDNERFTNIQRKLNQQFDGDRTIIDATRVMRLPGTLHQKGEPVLVTCGTLSGYGYITLPEQLETALAHVEVSDAGAGVRQALGAPEHAAPSLEWLQMALNSTDPNDMDRAEWISFTAAFKQAGWTLTDHNTLFAMWSEWCAKYEHNDLGENQKQWNDIVDTQIGWKNITNRTPNVKAHLALGEKKLKHAPSANDNALPPMPDAPKLDLKGELLTDIEQKQYFDGCIFVARFEKILVPDGRLMGATGFNAAFGGKKFIIDEHAKVTNEPWQAATRSTLWTVPKVDHVRFLPHERFLDVKSDELGRKGVNLYKPAKIESIKGDVTPFLNHLALILPIETDRKIFLDYLAHNVRYPGFKIPWAPLLQSAEGVGKGIIKMAMKYAVGGPYMYEPKASQMVNSGSQFNAWMRNKLFIIVDEIKTDERRDMIEILKPMITESEIEIQGKGVDQDKEDNYSNWLFFSNWKDAIPISKNGRRFAIFFSQIQTEAQLFNLGMNDDYFNELFQWMGKETHKNGIKIINDYFLNYPIERGSLSKRAPKTSSTNEALRKSRGPIEQLILDAVEDELPGFRGGYVSVKAVQNKIKSSNVRSVSPITIANIMENLGYTHIGRAPRPYFVEDQTDKSQLYHTNPFAKVEFFGAWQGYE